MNKEGLLSKAKQLINANPSNSGAFLMLKMSVNNLQDLEEALKEVAQQANDEFSKKDAIRVFGPELCQIATILYPNTPSHLPINLDEQKIKGGKADDMSVENIANKFGVPVSSIKRELQMGIKVELEHTSNKNTAQDIAMDHLTEMPDYYTRLNKMENQATKYWDKKEVKETKSIVKKLLHEALKVGQYIRD